MLLRYWYPLRFRLVFQPQREQVQLRPLRIDHPSARGKLLSEGARVARAPLVAVAPLTPHRAQNPSLAKQYFASFGVTHYL